MKRMLLTTAALFAVALLIITAPAAGAGTVTWKADTVGSGYWSVATNWSGDSVPGASDDVVLPERTDSATYTVTMDCAPGQCRTFSVATHAILTVPTDKRLEVGTADTGQSSTVDGQIALQASSSLLRIMHTHSVSGSGSITGSDSATIGVASGKQLTSTTKIQGVLTIGPDPLDENATGTSFVNDTGGRVIANDAGTLDIHTHAVSGAGDWEVSTSGSAVLQFTTGSQCLTGRFDVDDGTLNILADVCTTSVLDFQGGEIDVDGNLSFSAGGSCSCQ
jgi:hypothetical protein